MGRLRIGLLWVMALGGLTSVAMADDEWKLNGYLRDGRTNHTATLLPSGKVLVAGGFNDDYLSSAEVYDPDTGIWQSTGDLATPRSGHTATLLPSGMVLVVGGYDSSSFLSSVELYDPNTGTWQSTGALATPRSGHTATLLPSGKVLVVGGYDGSDLSSAELYDPGTGIWLSTGSLATARSSHTATLLPSGKVLVAGGYNGSSISSAELYDPSTGTWQNTGALATPQSSHTATLLPSGKVLVAGDSAELYDPSTGTWQDTGNLATPRERHTATLLPSGEVLVAGGWTGFYLSSAELYDPSTGTWQAIADLLIYRESATATLLPSGKVLVAGGWYNMALSSTEFYDPNTGTWENTGAFNSPQGGHTATLLPSGEVLVAGRGDSAELYDPSTGTWQDTGALAMERHSHTATYLLSGKVLVSGGTDGIYSLQSCELYDPGTGSWQSTEALSTPRENHTATLLPSGKVLVAGGASFPGPDIWSAELYDPSTGTWESAGTLATPRFHHTATLLPSGKVLIVGGRTDIFMLSSAELYDPGTGTWQSTGALSTPRQDHTATLLPSGKVLVAGGLSTFISYSLSSAELYDPSTGTWANTGALATPRALHIATLLPSGMVLVAAGQNVDYLSSAELYDPSTNTWASTGALATPRSYHTATLLLSGKVLVAGGSSADAEVYDSTSGIIFSRPIIQSTSQQLRYGQPFLVSGSNFRRVSEGSSGSTWASAVNYPLIRLRSLDGSQFSWLIPDPALNFWDDPMTLTVNNLPSSLNPGPHLLTVITAGVPSEPVLVEMECSLVITAPPSDQIAPIGQTVTFTVESQGGRFFQWEKDGVPIPGASEPSYTTPPVTAADSGSSYRVRVATGCTHLWSEPVALSIEDTEFPTVGILSPNGGDYWTLSEPDEPSNIEVVSWSMSDNVRICQIDASLWYSNDDGATWIEAPAGDGLPDTFGGADGPCPHPGVEETSLEYITPTAPPSGIDNSIYRVRVQATDQAGLTSTAWSEKPFFFVQPDTSVKTLILWHRARMEAQLGLSQERLDEVATRLADLAAHSRVEGLVVDLSEVTSLANLYALWDANPTSAGAANEVLFAENGLHDHILSLLDAYGGTQYMVLVGDDRIIPMARLDDRTILLTESTYLEGGDLTTYSRVGQALAANKYLSDDPLGVIGTVRPTDLSGVVHVPDLSIGRLVETPEEIGRAISSFIGFNGVLDLSDLDDLPEHKVLVTAYDFLLDGGNKIRRRWKNAFGIPEPHDPDALSPVDGQLVSTDWEESSVAARREALRTHLSGHDIERYGVMSLNGHATHYEEGVPGFWTFDIQGLDASDIYGPHVCVPDAPPALDLTGSVVYAIGCHGGLPVPGSCATDIDHSLDLPQTLLSRGVVAYVANSGYGWGLRHGIGYGERLVEIMTEELAVAGLVAVGDAVRRTKLRYFLEAPRFDVFDEKTVMQWTFFGLPMYAVKTGIAAGSAVERGGPVVVKGPARAASSTMPPHLTQLNLRFDFTAPGVYTKLNAAGDELPAIPGCPDPDGCYYRLNGLVERGTGTADMPIQPYFIYDSRLSGTSQHGALWMGGTYDEEDGWIPVIAELVSNGGDFSNHGSTPRLIKPKPFPRGHRTDDYEPECRPTDLELSTLVVVTGEALKDSDDDPTYTRERLFREIDLEILYFNDQGAGGNCDRSGPDLDPAFGEEYHEVAGATIDWAVSASDVAGVWRVVVVYDVGPDAQGRGVWEPLELTDDGSGTWRGSRTFPGIPQNSYVIQAVDLRGNVSWVDFVTADLPASGVAHDLPAVFDVQLSNVQADLSLELWDDPDPVSAGGLLAYGVAVENFGPDAATGVAVSNILPPEVSYVLAGGEGWGCAENDGTVTCRQASVPVGTAPLLNLFVTAPATSGTLTDVVSVCANEPDPAAGNDSAVEQTFVTSGADLAVTKSDGGSLAVPGQPLSYTISATNDGPEDVFGATVTDIFPAELSGVTWNCVATPGSSCTALGSGDIIDSVDLLSGGTVIFTAEGSVSTGAVGPIENTATISVPSGTVDPEPTDNAASVTTPVFDPAEIFLDGFESGDFSAWSNVIPLAAVVVTLDDELPEAPERFRARLVLGDVFDFSEGNLWIAFVADREHRWTPIVVGVVRRGERFELIVQLDIEARTPTGYSGSFEEDRLPQVLEFESRWSSDGGEAGISFDLWLDGQAPIVNTKNEVSARAGGTLQRNREHRDE